MNRNSQFWYFYVLVAMMIVQFLALLFLVGGVSKELIYLRESVNRLKRPMHGEVVTVRGGLLTVLNGTIYEMIPFKKEDRECDSKIK